MHPWKKEAQRNQAKQLFKKQEAGQLDSEKASYPKSGPASNQKRKYGYEKHYYLNRIKLQMQKSSQKKMNNNKIWLPQK